MRDLPTDNIQQAVQQALGVVNMIRHARENSAFRRKNLLHGLAGESSHGGVQTRGASGRVGCMPTASEH